MALDYTSYFSYRDYAFNKKEKKWKSYVWFKIYLYAYNNTQHNVDLGNSSVPRRDNFHISISVRCRRTYTVDKLFPPSFIRVHITISTSNVERIVTRWLGTKAASKKTDFFSTKNFPGFHLFYCIINIYRLLL